MFLGPNWAPPHPVHSLNCTLHLGWFHERLAAGCPLQAQPQLERTTSINSVRGVGGGGRGSSNGAVWDPNSQTPSTALGVASIRVTCTKLAFAVLGTGNSIEPRHVIPGSLKSPSSIFFLHHLVLHAVFYCSFLFGQIPSHLETLPHPLPCRGGIPWFSVSRSPRSSFSFLPHQGLTSVILSWSLCSCICDYIPFASRLLTFPRGLSLFPPAAALSPFSYPLPTTDLLCYYTLLSLLWLISPAPLGGQPTTYCVYQLMQSFWNWLPLSSPNWLASRACNYVNKKIFLILTLINWNIELAVKCRRTRGTCSWTEIKFFAPILKCHLRLSCLRLMLCDFKSKTKLKLGFFYIGLLGKLPRIYRAMELL